MSIQLWAATDLPYLELPRQFLGYALLAASIALVAMWLARTSPRFTRLTSTDWLLVGALSLLGALASPLLVLHLPPGDLLTPPGLPSEAPGPAFPLLGAVAFVAAGGLLGVGPAIVVGLFTGLARAGWQTNSLITPFETALLAGLTAWLMRQDYRGRPAAWIRRPGLAAPLAALSLWPTTFLSYSAYGPASGLATLDYVAGLAAAAAPVWFLQALVGGLAGEALWAAFPARWHVPASLRPPPYAASLNLRLLYSLVPLTVLGIAVLFWADTQIAIRVARDLVVDQMGRSAMTAGWGVPFFIQTGRSIILELARHREELAAEPLEVENDLSQGLRTIAYFKQLVYYNASGESVAGFPALDSPTFDLTDEERAAVGLALQGVPQDVIVPPSDDEPQVLFSFVAPVRSPGGGVQGALLGRASLSGNPLVTPSIQRLQGLIYGSGEGFLVDDRQRIIFHPDPAQQMSVFAPEVEARRLPTDIEGAVAYEDRYPDGTRRLVLYMPVSGHPWTVVVMVPHSVVLDLATRISAPILVILILIGGLGLLIALFVSGRLTRPVETLAQAAARITAGQLDQPVVVEGEDEVGRLGQAFERMRQSLHDRLGELNLLLRVTQGVAASLNLDESLPPILQGALAATGAAGVRVVLPSPNGAPHHPGVTAHALGPAAPVMAPLDRDILNLTHEVGTAVIENLSRARAVLDVSPVAGRIHALLALPLKQESNWYGALWVGYAQPHTFSEAEVNFLTTLSGQAAVAVANANLFKSAESGRRRLAAILASTPDSVIVTDNRNRLLLFNPAAESTFGIPALAVIGKPVGAALPIPNLARVLGEPGLAPANLEVRLDSGRTLYAAASAIVADDGNLLGRVCVLRDVTHFKEVDALKSEFVATVSHDLRAPLTLMRGYATMLPMIGSLNEKQKEFADRIMIGVEQMTSLIEDLLDLSRIEAGVGLNLEPVRLDEIIGAAVGGLKQQALNNGSPIVMDVARDLPAIQGDRTLLRQAVTNLLENAVKYSPGGGQICVSARVSESTLVFSVQDHGIGISPADQVRLFEKFYRVKQRDSTGVRGTGLGLAIVKSVAERHGGKAWVESRLGQGSTFYILLPVEGQSAAPN